MNILNNVITVIIMARYECEKCGWKGKPLFMEPATRLCPSCRSINVKKIKKA